MLFQTFLLTTILFSPQLQEPPHIEAVYRSPACEGIHSHVFHEDNVWVSGWEHDGWLALSLSEDGEPQRTGWYSDPECIQRSTHMSVDSDGIGYIASEGAHSLTSVDLNNVECPKTLDSWSDPEIFNCPVASVVKGDYCYAIARGKWQNFPGEFERKTGDSLVVFDIKDPSVIQPAAIIQDHDKLTGPRDIIISPDGSFVYIACLFNQSVVEVDIRNPLDPFIVRAVNTQTIECKPHSLAWVEEGVLGVCGARSMGIIDFSGQEPKIPGSHRDDDWLLNAYSIEVTGDYALVACRYGNSVSIFDISDLSAIRPIWKIADDQDLAGAYYITVSSDGRYAHVSAYSGSAFTIIDLAGITNPAMPSAWFLH